MHVPIKVKSPNNTSKWQIGFNSAFKGLNSSISKHSDARIWCDHYDGIMNCIEL